MARHAVLQVAVDPEPVVAIAPAHAKKRGRAKDDEIVDTHVRKRFESGPRSHRVDAIRARVGRARSGILPEKAVAVTVEAFEFAGPEVLVGIGAEYASGAVADDQHVPRAARGRRAWGVVAIEGGETGSMLLQAVNEGPGVVELDAWGYHVADFLGQRARQEAGARLGRIAAQFDGI